MLGIQPDAPPTSSTSIRCCRDWLPDLTLLDLALGTHGSTSVSGATATDTKFEVLRGDPQVVSTSADLRAHAFSRSPPSWR